MNAICHFRKCTLTNEELLAKVDLAIDQLYQTGTIPSRHIPALPDSDFDLLVGELMLRFHDIVKEQPNGKR